MVASSMAALSCNDPCSYSSPQECCITHVDLNLSVNFEEKKVSGTAHLKIKKRQENVATLILDTRDLEIRGVTDQETGEELEFSLFESNPVFGSKLEIQLPKNSDKQLSVRISYATSPQCTCLQWLEPRQTAGKRHPYLFSQCEAIHARSFLPCQDTPSVKFTYTAKVSAPREITVLMSAVRLQPVPCEGDSSQLIHQFEQKIPIPSYLLAIVAGDLESREIGPRSRVWSERELVDQAAYEFAETEHMLKTAEELLGEYVWGQYDLLILPPSFPFGGMENPCLTFVTPTLLAGDRSLADVVAHEIAHSWTGNLVTNSTFQDFWLNEGHTVFAERKITSRLEGGESLRNLLGSEGWKTLQETVNQLYKASEAPYTRLIPDLCGVDPDDAFSIVPYEKGFALLFYLESLLGGPGVFEPFLRAYISHFKFRSICSAEWKDFLFDYFRTEEDQEKLKGVDWQAWFYSEGMPPVQPQYDTSLALPCEELSSRWLTASDSELSAFTANDLENFSALQKRIFISFLLEAQTPLTVARLVHMESLYHLNKVKNSEIRFRWLRLCLKGRWEDAIPLALVFVTEQGRMKFVRPLYRDLYEWEVSRQRAISNFQQHEGEMHSTTAKLVAKDLHLSR